MFKTIKKDYLRDGSGVIVKELLDDEIIENVSLYRVLFRFLSCAGFRAVVLYRIGRWFRNRHWRLSAAITERLILHSTQCTISTNAEIGEGFVIRHVGGIVIGGGVTIGKNCELRQGVTLGGTQWKTREDGRHQPLLHSGVIIGAGAKLLGPIEVGEGSIIGANAVVVSDVTAQCVVGGIPARVIRGADGVIRSPFEQEGAQGRILRDLLGRIEKLEDRIKNFELDAIADR